MQISGDFAEPSSECMNAATIMLLIQYPYHQHNPYEDSRCLLLELGADLFGKLVLPNLQLAAQITDDILVVSFLSFKGQAETLCNCDVRVVSA